LPIKIEDEESSVFPRWQLLYDFDKLEMDFNGEFGGYGAGIGAVTSGHVIMSMVWMLVMQLFKSI